ncbi:MAG: nucleoside deaminase [Candidatus Omnitrophica bacterium]|nr:nucleoside deaminase [Candidatus Omnitrophota bacterium]
MGLILRNFNNHTYFMTKALELARRAQEQDEVPVGCVIVQESKIIAQAYNQVERLKDSTAHAEMIAITQAESYLGSKWLKGCRVYVTIEPCFMCACAFVLCRISKLFFGAPEPKTGAFGSVSDINRFNLNHRIEVSKGLLEDECRGLLQDFFKKKRQPCIG